MVALWVKGKRRIYGCNMLNDPGHLKSDLYPKIAGRHAELHVSILAKCMGSLGQELRGGTLYIAGVRSTRSRNVMSNTSPCKYCRELLTDTKIKYLVYFVDGQLVKETL